MDPAKQRRATGFRRVLGGLREAWLAVGLTLLALALAEGAARLALSLRRPAPDARIQADAYPAEPWVAELYAENARSSRMRWESYVYWRRLPFAGSQINVDQRGLRRTWRPPAAVGKPAAATVFFLGGSTAWGTGARDDHTIPSELARYLAGAGVPAAITNFGESGYVSTQAVITLLRELQRGNVPDLVVCYVGMNDTVATCQNRGAGLPLNESNRVREFNLLRHARRLMREALAAAAARSALLRLAGLAGGPGSPSPAPTGRPDARLIDETLRSVDANLRTVDGLAASYGFRTSFFWEPCIFEKPHRTAYEESRAAVLVFARDLLLATYDRVRRDWAARGPDEFTYLGDLFAGTTAPRFVDHDHTSETADREIAAAIGRQLLEHGRLRGSAGRGPTNRAVGAEGIPSRRPRVPAQEPTRAR
jgi:hypothetical protein